VSRPSLLHIVDPEDRRATLFGQAAAPAINVQTWTWSSVFAGDAVPVDDPTWVRLDAPGPDYAAHAIGDTTERFGRLMAHVERIEAAVGHTRMLTPASVVATLFDKSQCHLELNARKIPVPAALPTSPTSGAALLEELAQIGWSSAFVKPRHGSSASGVAAVRSAKGRLEVITTAARAPKSGELVNRIGAVRYAGDEAAEILDELVSTSPVHVERWFPKAAIESSVCDVRIVIINGVACHRVVRGAPGPITNLHAGGNDVSTEAFIAEVGAETWHAAIATVEQVATVFPEALHLGVDVAIGPRGAGHVVLEVNAFGDLLPRATWKGRSTYEHQVDALVSGAYQARTSQLTKVPS